MGILSYIFLGVFGLYLIGMVMAFISDYYERKENPVFDNEELFKKHKVIIDRVHFRKLYRFEKKILKHFHWGYCAILPFINFGALCFLKWYYPVFLIVFFILMLICVDRYGFIETKD